MRGYVGYVTCMAVCMVRHAYAFDRAEISSCDASAGNAKSLLQQSKMAQEPTDPAPARTPGLTALELFTGIESQKEMFMQSQGDKIAKKRGKGKGGPYGSFPEPHMHPSEIAYLDSLLDTTSSYLEYGSGGSTVLASGKHNIKAMRTMESDAKWIEDLKKNTYVHDALQISKLNLVHANVGPVGAWGKPSKNTTKHLWPSYSNYPGSKFDVVLIDGRFRVGCFLKAYRDAPRPVTLLVHDYSGRPAYHVMEQVAELTKLQESLAVFELKDPPVNTPALKKMIEKYEYDYA